VHGCEVSQIEAYKGMQGVGVALGSAVTQTVHARAKSDGAQ
jgi:hypothetical protein